MTVSPLSSYSSQSLGSDANWNGGAAKEMLLAKVSTRTVAIPIRIGAKALTGI